ncbi:hypothetical protein Tco_1076197 [Tanacetum coccineum]
MLEENYDKGHEDHRMACEALQTSILRDESEQFDADKSEERKKMKSKQDSLKTLPGSPPPPPPPPPPSGASGASGITRAPDSAQDPLPPPPSPIPNLDNQSPGLAAPGSSKIAATTAYTAWTTTISRFKPSASSIPEDVFIHEESDFLAQDMVSDDEDIGSRHIPRVNLKQDWFKPLSEDERPVAPKPAWSIPSSSLSVPTHNWASAITSSYVPPPKNSLLSQTSDIGVFIDWFCKKQGITELTLEHLEGPAYEVVKAFHPDVIHLQYQMEECHKLLTNQVDDRLLRYNVSRPLPLGGHLGLEFMHDYKILDSLRAVLFRDKYGMQMLMRFNEIHKFSDGTLQQIDEALDYRVKEFKVNKNNLALNTRTWKALLVEEYAKETADFYGEPNDDILSVASRTLCVSYKDGKVRYSILRSHQSQRDLPRDNPLVSVEVLRWQSAPASAHLNQNALLSLEPRDHHKSVLGPLFLYCPLPYTVENRIILESYDYPCDIDKYIRLRDTKVILQ